VHALVQERAVSAHEIFKSQYSRTLRWSVICALLVLVLAVLVMPEYRPTPYRLTQEEIELVNIQVIEPPLVEPKTRPIRPPAEVVVAPPGVQPDPFPDPFPIEVEPKTGPWIDPAPPTIFVPTSENPQLLQGAVADYPEIARLAGMQGTVVVKVQVDTDGSVSRVEILKGIHPLLDKPALAAARKLRFAPGTQRGMPVRCFVAVPFRFYLH